MRLDRLPPPGRSRSRKSWSGPARWLAIASLALLLGACSKPEEIIIAAAAAEPVTAEQIDADPWALLPGGGYGFGYLDARALAASPLGPKLLSLFSRQGWLPDANAISVNEIETVFVGLYTMQGADMVGVARGNFDASRVDAAIAAAGGAGKLKRIEYARRAVYHGRGAGFSVLTSRTLLFGSEAGVRRGLDRIAEARMRPHVPGWLEPMLSNPDAPMVGGVDLRAHPVPDAVRREAAFVDGLHTARLVGNFKAPGVNVAATLSYEDGAAAGRGASNLNQLKDLVRSYGWLMALVGIDQPLRRLQAEASETDVKFVAELDAEAMGRLLDRADELLPKLGGAR